MKRWLKYSGAVFVTGVVVVLAMLCGATLAQSMPNPATIVKALTYVSLDPVPKEQTFEVAVVVQIQPGYHMNSHTPSEDYLIPTTITITAPAGITVLGTLYPEGQLKTFAFSPNKPLSVYTDKVSLRMKLRADSGVAVGPLSIPGTLRYQACNDQACLPPVKVPVVLSANVAIAGAKAHQVNPAIFSAKP